MTESFRAGDQVRHVPTGETWIVAWCNGPELSWCGYPDGVARTADCTLIQAATDEEHLKTLSQLAFGGGSKAEIARKQIDDYWRNRSDG